MTHRAELIRQLPAFYQAAFIRNEAQLKQLKHDGQANFGPDESGLTVLDYLANCGEWESIDKLLEMFKDETQSVYFNDDMIKSYVNFLSKENREDVRLGDEIGSHFTWKAWRETCISSEVHVAFNQPLVDFVYEYVSGGESYIKQLIPRLIEKENIGIDVFKYLDDDPEIKFAKMGIKLSDQDCLEVLNNVRYNSGFDKIFDFTINDFKTISSETELYGNVIFNTLHTDSKSDTEDFMILQRGHSLMRVSGVFQLAVGDMLIPTDAYQVKFDSPYDL